MVSPQNAYRLLAHRTTARIILHVVKTEDKGALSKSWLHRAGLSRTNAVELGRDKRSAAENAEGRSEFSHMIRSLNNDWPSTNPACRGGWWWRSARIAPAIPPAARRVMTLSRGATFNLSKASNFFLHAVNFAVVTPYRRVPPDSPWRRRGCFCNGRRHRSFYPW
jgi:hypothetical protein